MAMTDNSWLQGLGANQIGGGLAGLLSGLFGHSGNAYGDASHVLSQYFPQAMNYFNQGQQTLGNDLTGGYQQYSQAGANALPQYQNWLNQMQDPTAFINRTMGQYQESPWAKYEQAQAMRAANNMGSASGLTGSTPLMQEAQQNASNISSQDMNQWLGNIMGINQQYGAGLQNIISGGQNAQNAMTNTQFQQQLARAGLSGQQANFLNQFGGNLAGLAYGQQAGRQQDQNNTFGGLGSIIGGILSLFK